MYFKTLLITATTAVLLFSGCKDDRSTDLQDSLVGNTVDDKIAGYAIFNPDAELIPYPNNILFAPNSSGADDYDYGQTLNIPYEEGDLDANIKRQLNTLTGFSTTSPITAPITATLDPSTIPGGVKLYEVDINASGAVTGIANTLQYGVDYIPTQSGSNIVILPLKPLASLSNYMVVLTSDLQDTNGRVLAPDIATALTLSPNPVEASDSLDAETAAALETIRLGNRQMLTVLALAGKDPSNTVQIWSFRTQMIGAVQANIAAAATGDSVLSLGDTSMTTKVLFGMLGMDTTLMDGNAEIYDGNISAMPQYMPQASQANPLPVFQGEFSYSAPFTPVFEANVTIPVIATLPNSTSGCTMPTNGWPVVIYQHGITRDRTDLFVYGETLAKACYAGIAIDLPLHGVTDDSNPFYKAGIERTYDLDLATEIWIDGYGYAIQSYTSDGIIDSTGAHYMNLPNVITTRDNLHQTTSDLLQLQNAIAAASGITFDPTRISFLSHSLGNMASIGFLNHTTSLSSAVLAMPGQQFIPLLDNSAVFGPAIESGLAAKGIIKGTAEYDAFMLASQTLVDDADPANYSATVGAGTLPILEIAAVGDGTEGSGDQHIPYTVATAPLAGGKPFIDFTGAQDINTSGLSSGDIYLTSSTKTVTKLTEGEHRSALDPQYSMDAFIEVHTELISFIGSNGTAIQVANPAIIQK
ncbi:hypothetical protein [Sulfurimonas sp. HSL3-7]|uniref:hypothetical protein n=1 Tax=Sulfonitrofixus jiaomeiensis TaxID=3131938 RepID=UPI0031F80554